MNYDVGACKHCAKIAGITKDKKCEACGAERETVPLYTWFHQDYDLIEDPEIIEKLDEMDNSEVKAAAVSGAELKIGLRDMFICFGIAVGALLLGLVCIKGAGGQVKGRMTFMGLLFLLAAPAMLIAGVCMFFRRVFAKTRAKTPEKAFELFWKDIFEFKTFSDKYEDAEIAVNKITRSLPGAVRQTMDAAKMMSWIGGLRTMIAGSNSELAEDCHKAFKDKIFDAKGDKDALIIQDISTETVDEHKAVISADLVIYREWTRSVQKRNDYDYFNYKMSAGILHARTTVLKAGEYWYVPDWMPRAEKGEKINSRKEADPE